ncbi:hypothetical protein [Nonomuraea sp. KM90]|uniref:hypothetical protein n=1 Tax=Nonomuraea sp. KM90 TaxID=3457428 RepID=UPI003FCE3E0D
MADQPVKEMRAAALWLRDAYDPYAVAAVVDGTFVRVCAGHDEPAIVCKACDWFDAGSEGLAVLMVALLNARGPLRTLLEVMATLLAQEGLEPRGALAYSYATKTARAVSGISDGQPRPDCCRCFAVDCETDESGDHCIERGCAYCLNGCPATDRPCCREVADV